MDDAQNQNSPLNSSGAFSGASEAEKISLEKRLLETGWQSWSSPGRRPILSTHGEFSPSPDDSLIVSSTDGIRLKPSVKGWCSWYAFFDDIDHEKITAQAEWFANRPEIAIEYILIDDGYTLWGDWAECHAHKFPKGLKASVEYIRGLNLKAGVWMAPFSVDEKSSVAALHPEWLLKADGSVVRHTEFDGVGPMIKYVLDIRNPEALAYAEGCVRHLIEECGFELLKLDFLYMIYNERIPASESALLLNSFLRWIQSEYPHVYTIACGCPLIPAVGAVDSMRIGPDVIVAPFYRIPFVKGWYNSLRLSQVLANIERREWTKTLWNLDPDAFICRQGLGIRTKKLRALAEEIKRLNGNIFLGDDMTKLPEKRIKRFILNLFS